MGNERADHELEIFGRFAVAAGLSTSKECGEKRKPPEPDIVFKDSSGSQIAFELVELLDEDYGRRIGLLVGTKTALRTHYENLPPEKKTLFDQKFGNALLYFRFSPALSFKRRRATFETVFDRLLDLPDGFSGDAFEDENQFFGLLDGVSISRGKFRGPIFDPESVGWVGDPTVPAIAQKFTKNYKTTHPIELLAYIEINPMFPDEVWIADVEEFLSSQSRPLPFRRIWVFHAGQNQVKFCYE